MRPGSSWREPAPSAASAPALSPISPWAGAASGSSRRWPAGSSSPPETGAERPVLATRHHLDLDRLLVAAVEGNRDDAGIVWPRPVAPFEVLLVVLDPGDEAVRVEAERIYRDLQDRGADVLYDDREERPGAKFHDADLVGFPVRIVVGRRSLADGRVEVSRRRAREKVPVDRADAVERALALLEG